MSVHTTEFHSYTEDAKLFHLEDEHYEFLAGIDPAAEDWDDDTYNRQHDDAHKEGAR